jgi:WD40 repeat protein
MLLLINKNLYILYGGLAILKIKIVISLVLNGIQFIGNFLISDLFAAGYGTYDFGKNSRTGMIALYSFKNVKYPENIIQCEDSVMSLDFHPQSPALLVVGLYNGIVLVFDIRNKDFKPIYKSCIQSKKHTGKQTNPRSRLASQMGNY